MEPTEQLNGRRAKEIPRFSRPYDFEKIVETTRDRGAAILEGLIEPELNDRLEQEVAAWFAKHGVAGTPQKSPLMYAHQPETTIGLYALCNKIDCISEYIVHEDVLPWAERLLKPYCSQIVLTTAHFVSKGPGPSQFPHRDTDLWVHVRRNEHPLAVNVRIALSEFTVDNGATFLAMDSWDLPDGKYPEDWEYTQAVMQRGDALYYRADLFHGGAENRTAGQTRRAVELGYQVGWLRPYENHMLNVPPPVAAKLPRAVQDLLGYELHDASAEMGGPCGFYEEGHPRDALLPYLNQEEPAKQV
ncbi:hypothetical protein DMH04_26570 [Kibdelosporangium aridum]|uniref:Phytanoyl-CoA dioxygenase n=1 Tax=Kibdelosporangium aridum TaxID=2030 RepID=A0A428Z528_KIBAR|nr:phytanoyl-CoA dioxygenase family protein [Kibdelosporangium aridum]RSM81914.1 hypothetical protein DMH04_26570 [Kibdelosporangium aridum]